MKTNTTVTNHAATHTNSPDCEQSIAGTVVQVIVYPHLPKRKKKKKE